MQDRSPPARRNHLQRTAGPYIRATSGLMQRSKYVLFDRHFGLRAGKLEEEPERLGRSEKSITDRRDKGRCRTYRDLMRVEESREKYLDQLFGLPDAGLALVRGRRLRTGPEAMSISGTEARILQFPKADVWSNADSWVAKSSHPVQYRRD